MQYTRDCEFCDKSFESNRRDKRFCTDSCRAMFSASKRQLDLPPTDERELPPRANGFIYIIKDISVTGYCKIGLTKSLKDRLHRFEVTLPFEWELLHTFASSDVYTVEKILHEMFHQKHRKGEWYELSNEDITYIQNIRGI